MHFNNERWAAQALGMSVNPSSGPDLIDDQKVVEVKFKLSHPERYTNLSWRVLGHQKEYGNLKEAYWALGTYTLDREIASIKNPTLMRSLERMVIKRELFIVNWDWMDQFQEYRESGKTEVSQWDQILIFPKGRLLPATKKTYQVTGGIVHITQGINPERFPMAI